MMRIFGLAVMALIVFVAPIQAMAQDAVEWVTSGQTYWTKIK